MAKETVTNTALKEMTKNQLIERAEKREDALSGVLRFNASLMRSDAIQRLLNPDKDINYSCGYPNTITIDDYKGMYARDGVANRVVNIFPDESWAIFPEIYETEDSDKTVFEQAWDDLEENKNLFHYLHRADKLSGVGAFGVLLLGLDDGKDLDQPVDGIDLMTGEKVKGSREHKLLFLKPFDEKSVVVKSKESRTKSPRYGFPTIYEIDYEGVNDTQGDITQKMKVHWTRVIHLTDNREGSEINGTPRMKPVYNRLLDIRKILSGSGEMFWKGGFPGYSVKIDPDITDADFDLDSVREQFRDYSQGLQRYLAMEGVSVESLAPQVADPKGHVEAHLKSVALSLGIPYRILFGSEESKLAGENDNLNWLARVRGRQEKYLTPMVVRVFIDRLIIYGVLPEVERYTVNWPDLNVPTDKDIADTALVVTDALAKYVQSGLNQMIAPYEYLTTMLKMEEDEAKAIIKAAGLYTDEDEQIEKEKEAQSEAEKQAAYDAAVKAGNIAKPEVEPPGPKLPKVAGGE